MTIASLLDSVRVAVSSANMTSFVLVHSEISLMKILRRTAGGPLLVRGLRGSDHIDDK